MKKSIVAVAVFAVALFAQADVLYWMVSDEIAETAAENGTASPFATLYAVSDADSSKTALDSRSEGQVYTAYDVGSAFQYSGIESYNSGYSFLVEIMAGEHRGESYSVAEYASLRDYIVGSGHSLPSSSFAAAGFGGGTSTFNVPEPTSGLLFLVGGMLLGLKRRRQQV